MENKGITRIDENGNLQLVFTMKRKIKEVEKPKQKIVNKSIFKRKQLYIVVDGGHGARGADGKIGVIVPKNGNINIKEGGIKKNFPDCWNLNESRYHGEYSKRLDSGNPLFKTYDKESKRFEYWGLCDGYHIEKYSL